MHFASSLESFSAVGTHSLQGARLPHSPHSATFSETSLESHIKLFQRVIWYNTFLIQAGIDPLCDMLDTEPRAIITLPAQRTHEAAREGVVPLCGDSLWNPNEPLDSPHSGLMRQPTMEGPVWDIFQGTRIKGSKGVFKAC